MKRRLISALTVAGLLIGGGAQAFAGNFLFGEETKGVTFTANESDLNLRVRLQPRFDFGDIIKSSDGTSYENNSDLYLRRVRLELSGHLLTKTIVYNLTLHGDKWEKIGNTNEIGIRYAYVQWNADDAVALMVGKEKLPFSRVSLASSSKQLLIERPVSTEAAKSFFGASDAYYQPKAAAKGKLMDGVFAYEVAVADGWQNGESVQSGRTVLKSSPLVAGRVELSPPGFAEKSKSDAHLGAGKHLTLGVDYVVQNSIEYKENTFQEDRSLLGVDLSGHMGGLTGQIEYNTWESDSEDPSIADKKPWGWYAQAGYFIDGINIEPMARYEVYDQDSKSSDKKEKNTTVGLNWYGKGHSLKVGANWVHTKYENNASGRLANDDKKDVFQLQAQMYF